MMVSFVSPEGIEPWDWRSPDTTGLGGSETCIVELARRLAERGHDVRVYCQCFSDTQDQILASGAAVRWRSVASDIDVEEPGSWFLCRAPRLLDHFTPRSDQRLYLRVDDMHHGAELTLERASKLNGIVSQSPFHRGYLLGMYPFLRPDHVFWPGCGIDVERMEKLELGERYPFRLVWTSSYDRGLDHAIAILQKVRRYEPRFHLHVYYGWEGYDRVMARMPQHPLAGFKARVLAMDLTHVTFGGRVAKETLWRALGEASVWLYPSAFEETACCACMEAQAMGAIPITAPVAALRDSMQRGCFIKGHPADPAVQDQYVDAILDILDCPVDERRPEMMTHARQTFGWHHAVDLHARLIGERRWLHYWSMPDLGQPSVAKISNGQTSEESTNDFPAQDLRNYGHTLRNMRREAEEFDPRTVPYQGDR